MELGGRPKSTMVPMGKYSTVICLIEAPGAIARLNLVPWIKS